ncbi:MAG TPA: 5'-nucleotidase C-terminal domain-containing protein [Thermoanaerobaculia bacterium]|nr:5'-nucleotidase C-terminal domain-containing protein [Thermoanaerobaculia bacterium]
MSWRSSLREPRFLCALVILVALPAAGETVTLLHFSDYHSHALPFYSEGRGGQGGLARGAGFLARHKRNGALVFSGGDMMNKGAPAWSDKYGCVEWSWLNGIVDAMAFGNHDADYGWEAWLRCRDSVRYPILSANIEGFPRYTILDARGKRIGVFALAGSDFPSLVRLPELKFTDRIAAAREVVKRLRDVERVDAVVLIGHEHGGDDQALARAVPGIDVIFGTHGHEKKELAQIPGTGTWTIAPFQYLAYVSRVDLIFTGGRLTSVRGSLVPVDARMPLHRAIARNVGRLQRELEKDPQYRHLFVPFAALSSPISVNALGRLTVGVMRDAARADVAVSTRSSFRGALPPGPIDLETLRAAMPYDNELVVAEMTPATYARLLEIAAAAGESESGVYSAGAPVAGSERVTVATTDYLARVAGGYREVFTASSQRGTGLRIRELVRERIVAGARAP